MTVRAWVASNTGLPSFFVSADERIEAPGGRVLRLSGRGALEMLSDALATPGVPTTYKVGAASITLTRRAGNRHHALITNAAGRGIPGLIAVNNEDPVSWRSSVSISESRSVRWRIVEPPASGTTECVIEDPAVEARVWELLRRRSPIIVGPASDTPGVPLRRVIVTSVKRTRFGPAGHLRFSVDWTEDFPRDSIAGAAPVVTWGEWMEYRESSGDRADYSYVELAGLIAGMPS